MAMKNVVNPSKVSEAFRVVYNRVVQGPLAATKVWFDQVMKKLGDLPVPANLQVQLAGVGPMRTTVRESLEGAKESVVRMVNSGGNSSNTVEVIDRGIAKTRPSWRQSEIDVGTEYPGYRDQVSFKDGNEVNHGTKNSSRPDFYISGHSIEVKNYKLTTSSGRKNLIRNVSKQINKRISDLPEKTNQSVIIDVRGQSVSRDVLRDIKQKINERTKGVAEIIFKMD
ncbi:hypothetical protein [Bacillus canaveralius]|uniref:hypothetical protein n=1 Tax=Bacillus canaveralius TaxID=1403243 RepID=UPI001639B3C7|nr:hypothetical protein [Bacillus canaveralius]